MDERELRMRCTDPEKLFLQRDPTIFDHGWLKPATRRIVLRRDRRIVREELSDHFRQRSWDFFCRGLSLKEAQERAVEALGDPKEVSRLLARVHQPVLSWCLRLTRILLALLILAAVISWLKKPGSGSAKQNPDSYEYTLAQREGVTDAEWELGVFDVRLREAQQRMIRTDWYEVDGETETRTNIYYSYELRLELESSAAPWYSMDPSALEKGISIIDDHGIVHRSYYYSGEAELWDEEKHPTWFDASRSVFTVKLRENVEWVDLVYEGEAGKRTMHVSFAPWETVESEGTLPLKDESEQVQRLTGPEWDSAELQSYEILSVRELTVSGEPEDGSLRVPWARVVHLRPLEENALRHEHYLVEFIAVTRGPLWEMLPTAKYTSQFQRLNFTLTAEGARVHRNETPGKNTLSFADAFVSRNRFYLEVAAERYELTYEGPEGPITLTLTAGEEAAP